MLVIPGLDDSGPGHWQTELQRHHRTALRVRQHDWHTPDLDRWAARIGNTLAREPEAPWVAVAHSFGCLALVRWLLQQPERARHFAGALLVAPADPGKFGVGGLVQGTPALPVPPVLVASRTDPWLAYPSALSWARTWGAGLLDVGDAGHINVASGHGPWPLARRLVERQLQQVHARRRAAAESAPA